VALVTLAGALPATAGFAAGRYKPRLLFLLIPISLAAALAVPLEIRDPFVGPAIRAEAGAPYVFLAYVTLALTLLAPIAGLWFRYRDRFA
jgi:hypothetical protein